MTFWDFWTNNRQKVLGSITAFFSVLGGLLASGSFENLLSRNTIAWLGIIVALVTGVAGGATAHSGFANTTRERIAASAATVATAEAKTAEVIQTALNTSPPGGTP